MPFYKRDLSFKRAPKEWDAAEPAASKPKMRRLPRPKPSLSKTSLPGSSAKKIVGLKIGGSQIAAASVQQRQLAGARPGRPRAARPRHRRRRRAPRPRGARSRAAGLLQAPQASEARVRLGIANNRIGVRTFEVTGIDDPKQLANAIRFRAQEVLPIPIEEAVLDYQVLSRVVNEEGQPVSRVLLVVAYRELVDRYVYACKKAGLQIVGIDLEAFALLRAIAEPHDPLQDSERGALVARLRRPRPLDFRRLRRPHLRVHARARVGRLVAERGDRPRARHLADRGRADQARPVVHRRPRCPRASARSSSRPRARRQAAAADVRAGARLLAPVLPEPARLAGHRRDRPDGRHRAPARARRGARAADRRAGPRRRSVRPRQGLEEGCASRSSSARSPSPSASGSRTSRCAPSTFSRRTSSLEA